MAYEQSTVASSAARTTTGTSGVATSGASEEVGILVAVTAVSGTTPSMTVSVEWSMDGTTFAASDPPDTMTALTSVTSAIKLFAVKAPYYRLRWTITGTTPSFTFSAVAYTN